MGCDRPMMAMSLILLLACDSSDGRSPWLQEHVPSPALPDTTTESNQETDDPVEDECIGLPDVTWTNWGAGFFRSYCTSCHSADAPDRWGAPIGVDFDTREQVEAQRAEIHNVVLETGRMPVGGGVHPADLELLQIFLECGL